jgi:hypothetical protein
MKTPIAVLATIVATASPALAQTTGLRDPLLDRMIGEWVLEGTIAGTHATHDVVFEWVLGHQYVRFHELARETDPVPYEAIVFIGWEEESQQYACLWLDSTGGEGLTAEGIGHGAATGDSIPFLFHFPDGSPFHTTFIYDRDADTWEWHLDGDENGVRRPFARVTLSRR